MQEQQIRLVTAVATGLWALALALIGAGIVTDQNGIPGLGVLSGMAASVIQVRSFFAEHKECIREAFEMGRDHERLRALR